MLPKNTNKGFLIRTEGNYFTITLLLILVIIINVESSCPHLKPNKNVITACSNGKPTDKRQLFKCNPTNSQVATGTIAMYKCSKHFKPIDFSSRLNGVGGKMQCTDKGIWSNIRAFKEFHCELECGKQPAKRNSLISFGNQTNAHYWPWVATIFRRINDRLLYTCGGSLIGQKTILTAAHCLTDNNGKKIPSSSLRVVLASVSSDFNVNMQQGSAAYSVQDVHIHPDFYAKKFITDVALIELADLVVLSESVLPVCLPFNYEQDELTVSPGNFGEVASFGIDETGKPAPTLQYGKIPIVNRQSCHSVLKRVPRSEQFCAGQDQGPNICRGDSGAGMVFRSFELDEEKYTIHGIVSNTGRLQNGCAKVVVFAKVFEYIRWIEDVMLLSENSNSIQQHEVQNTQAQRKSSKTLQIDPDMSEEDYDQPPPEKQQQQSKPCLKSGDLCFPVHEPKRRRPITITTNKPYSGSIVNHANFIAAAEVGKIEPINYYTKLEKIALSLFRPLVENILVEGYMHTDEYLIKWLRAKKLHIQEAKKFLGANLEWRKANRMNEILTEDFKKFQQEYKTFFQGFDKDGRPIATTLLGQFDFSKIVETGQTNQFKRYLNYRCEQIANKIRNLPMKNITQSVVIYDLYGFNARQHLCPKCIEIYTYCFRLQEVYFPADVFATYFINMPAGFEYIRRRIITPNLSDYTKKNVRYFGTNKAEWIKELLKQIPSDQLYKRYGGTKAAKKNQVVFFSGY